MFKKFCLVLGCLLFACVLFADNLQRTYLSVDEIYKKVNSLALRAGKIGTSGESPISGAELLVVLDRINPNNLSADVLASGYKNHSSREITTNHVSE